MPEIILFLLAVFAVGVAVVIGIRAVSDYYATHYSFSIWAGGTGVQYTGFHSLRDT